MADADSAASRASKPAGRAARKAPLAFWLLNVPLGMWCARGYYLTASAVNVTLAGRAMSLWLLAAGVGLALLPGLLAWRMLLGLRARRLAAAWAVSYAAALQALLLADSAVYHLVRIHVTDAQAMALLWRRGALAAVGITQRIVWQGVWWAVGLLALEVTLLLGMRLLARRTPPLARLRAAAARLPKVVRWGALAALVLPGLTVALWQPRGAILETARHFLVPLAPPVRDQSPFVIRANRALRVIAAVDAPKEPPSRLPLEAAPLDAPPARPLNILLVSIESLRTDAVTPDTMPHLAALARECVVAPNHYVEGNSTHHSFFATLAGLHPYWYGLARRRQAPPVPLDVLRQAGYALHVAAGATVDWRGMAHTVFPRRLFATYEAHDGDPVRNDRIVTDRLLELARSARKPFFAVGIYNSTHFLYFYPPDEEHFKPVLNTTLTLFNAYRLRGRRAELWNRYRNAARYVDRLLGELVAALRRDGLLDKMILVVTADHGESLLEDGIIAHGGSFHDNQVRVPMLIRYPGGKHRRVEGLTQNADLLPSLFAELGISSDAVRRLPGYRTLRRDPDERRPCAVVAMASGHTPVEYLLVGDAVRLEFLFNIEPSGRVVLEARRGQGSPEQAVALLDSWLAHEHILRRR